MTVRKTTSRTRAAGKAPKTIDLTADDITEREQTEATAEMLKASDEPKAEPSDKPAPEAEDTAQKAETDVDAASSEPTQHEDVSKDAEETVLEQESVAPQTDGDRTIEDKDGGEPVREKIVIQTAPPPNKDKGGFASGLLGGLLGGVAIVALSYFGLQQGYIALPGLDGKISEQAGAVSSLQSDLSLLQNKIAEMPSSLDTAPLEARLQVLEGEIAGLSQVVPVVPETTDTEPAGAEQGEAPDGSAQLDGPVDSNSPVALQLEALTGRIEAIKQQVTELEALKGEFLDAKAQLAQLEVKTATQSALIVTQAEELTAKLEQDLDVAKGEILSSTDRRVNDVVTDLSNLGETMEVQTASIRERVTSLEENNLSEKMQSSARTIALAGLENASASGAPFVLALDTFAEVVGEHDAVIALKAQAESGAPTNAQLQSQFRDVYDAVLKEAEGAGAATLLDKFMLNAQQLVKVRSLSGEQKGDSLTSQLGVIEYHIGNGDLAKAATQWDSLPPAARDAKAGETFVNGLKARMAVDAAMDIIHAEFGKNANNNAS